MRFTKEMILRHVTEYQIFRYYLGVDFKLGVAFRSPLREERNPSFNIYKGKKGGLYFKDFGAGREGDCFDFVMLKYNIGFPAALMMVGVDFDISSFEGKSNDFHNRKNMIRTYANKLNIGMYVADDIGVGTLDEPEEREIKSYDVFPLDEKESKMLVSAYFSDRYGINSYYSREIKYNISAIKSVEFTANSGKKKTITSEPGNPIFMYRGYGDHKSVRFYRPFANQYQLKHFGSIVKGDFFGKKFLETLNSSVRKNIRIVFCAGQKDALCVTQHFEDCVGIAMGSEGNKIPPDVLSELYMMGFPHDKMFILYDNDKTGIERAMKLSKETGLRYVKTGEFFAEMALNAEMIYDGCKDISDACEIILINKETSDVLEIMQDMSEIVSRHLDINQPF